MFPNDAIQVYTSVNTNSSTTLYSSNATTTILYFFTTHDYGDGTDGLYCGNTLIFSYPTKSETSGDIPALEMRYLCNKNVYYKNGGSADTDQTLLILVPYNLTKIPNYASDTISLIQNSQTGAEFYVEKTINYGDVLFFSLLLPIAIFLIVKTISDFWIPKRTDFKK